MLTINRQIYNIAVFFLIYQKQKQPSKAVICGSPVSTLLDFVHNDSDFIC